jgi:regulator of RNase E activity RraA
MAMLAVLFGLSAMGRPGLAQDRPSGIAASKADVMALTSEWKGERSSDGRPMVSDELLERMKAVSIEEAWDVLRLRGYTNQFNGGWEMLHPDKPFVGRALTASYMPGRPDLLEETLRKGKEEGRIGPPNSWPIDVLRKGDVYIADGFGKISGGTLIGDNLGNAIYARSKTGVVFDAAARDIEGLAEIEGFNAFVRGWDPTLIDNMIMTSINRPIRIGAITVLPGDVILAKREGIIVIPPHLAQEVVETSEIVALKDEFGHLRLKAAVYTPGQIDVKWTEAIKADFFQWLDSHPKKPPIAREQIEKHL